jgi:hypothetical protein
MRDRRGGFIGSATGPAAADFNSAASGIWTLREAESLKRAGTWPRVLVPTDLAGLQLWLDASDASTLYDATSGGSLVAADGAVARWEDKSGNARHATQGTSGSRPLRKTSVQGGKDVLRFDGSDDSLSIASSTATFKFLHSADSTVFAVFKSGTTSNPGQSTYGILYTCRSSFAVVGYGIDALDSSPLNDAISLTILRGVGGSYNVYNEINGGFPSNQFALAAFVTKPTNGTAANRSDYRKNGGAASQNNAATGAASAANSQADLTLGMVPIDNAGFLNGDIAEIVIYNAALSDTDRASVENFLISKWHIT